MPLRLSIICPFAASNSSTTPPASGLSGPSLRVGRGFRARLTAMASKGGNLKRLVVADVDDTAHNLGDRVNLRVRRISHHQLFLRLVNQPRSVVVAPARVPV